MKKLLSLAVVASLALSLVACGDKTPPATSQSDSSTTGASGSATTGKDWSKQEAYTLKLMLPGTAKAEDCEEIARLATEITLPKYNTTIEIARVGFGTYAQEVNLMFSSGEKLDMLYNNRDIFVSAVNSGQILEIGEYLDEYAPEMKAAISEDDWATVSIDGGIYGVPANKEKAVAWGFTMNKEIADATGIDYSQIDTEEELEPLLRKVKEMYPDMYPVGSNGGTMNTMTTSDDLGYDFGVLKDCTDPTDKTVVNWYGTDIYKEIVERRWNWTKDGLIMADAASNTDPWATLISSGKVFGRFCNVKPGIEAEHQKSTGIEMVVLPMTKAYTTTTRLDILWYVAHNSEKPERTVQIMNEIYTNPDLQNVLCNGVEGKHYEYKNAEKTIVGYPEGVDGSNTGYPSYPWAWMNEMITPVWEGSAATLWTETEDFNKTAIVSPAKGFAWDNSTVLNEVTACNNVRTKYANALDCGSVNPDEALPKFLKELEDSGVNKIITEKQAQLDAWFAAQK
ncbi:MAG: ABC transporter substrate-binding protein [Oscillospiraceae bacterium]